MAVSMIHNYGANESETGGGVQGEKDHELSHAAITQKMEWTFGIKCVEYNKISYKWFPTVFLDNPSIILWILNTNYINVSCPCAYQTPQWGV